MDSNEVWFRKKYHKFIADNIDSDSAIDKIFTFAKRYGMFVSNNVNDQESGNIEQEKNYLCFYYKIGPAHHMWPFS